MSAKLKRKYIAPEEYLALEREAFEKHEYFDGEIFEMAGTSEEHANIVEHAILIDRRYDSQCQPQDQCETEGRESELDGDAETILYDVAHGAVIRERNAEVRFAHVGDIRKVLLR